MNKLLTILASLMLFKHTASLWSIVALVSCIAGLLPHVNFELAYRIPSPLSPCVTRMLRCACAVENVHFCKCSLGGSNRWHHVPTSTVTCTTAFTTRGVSITGRGKKRCSLRGEQLSMSNRCERSLLLASAQISLC